MEILFFYLATDLGEPRVFVRLRRSQNAAARKPETSNSSKDRLRELILGTHDGFRPQ